MCIIYIAKTFSKFAKPLYDEQKETKKLKYLLKQDNLGNKNDICIYIYIICLNSYYYIFG